MKILIVAKESKYEYEKRKFGLSHDELVGKYNIEHANLKAILDSHERQVESRKKIRELLPDAELIMMDELKSNIIDYDLVISLGGDNSFTYVSHFVKNIPIAGVNSDPERSTGALCLWGARNLDELVGRIESKDYRIEEWTRLQAAIDGKPIMPATSEYFFGERLRKDMSRYKLVYRGKEYEQKSSGVIVSTGAGSTGWYDSSVRLYMPDGAAFPKTDKKAKFVVTEPFRYKDGLSNAYFAEILPEEELVLYSLNDSQGYASSDSWDEYDFSRGRKAVIRISDQPLHVVVP